MNDNNRFENMYKRTTVIKRTISLAVKQIRCVKSNENTSINLAFYISLPTCVSTAFNFYFFFVYFGCLNAEHFFVLNSSELCVHKH